MELFEYVAYEASGAKVQGTLEALTKDDALAALQKKGLLVSQIKLIRAGRSAGLFFKSKISLSDLEFLTAELSLLLESGVRIDKGLDIIKRTKAKPALAILLGDISGKLKKGHSLSQSCRAFPDVFDDLYCNLIELGEASGNLSDVFADLAKDLKFKRELRNKIISSLAYPSVIFFVCLLSIIFVFNFIIPKMAGMFSDVSNLPWYTSLMLNVSEWMINYQMFLLVGVLTASFAVISALKKDNFKHWIQKKILKTPILSEAILIVERIRFNSGLAMMIKAGVPIDKSLTLATGNIKNYQLRHELNIAKKKVKRGGALSPALKQTSLYPAFFVSLLEVGEESGNLERVFNEIANRSRIEFESWTQRITTLLEPLMIIFMGGIVGSVVVVMLLSMVSMNDIGF